MSTTDNANIPSFFLSLLWTKVNEQKITRIISGALKLLSSMMHDNFSCCRSFFFLKEIQLQFLNFPLGVRWAKASLRSLLARIRWLQLVCIRDRRVCLMLLSLRLRRRFSFNSNNSRRVSERNNIRRKELNLRWANSSAARKRRPARVVKIVCYQPVELCLHWPVEMTKPMQEIQSLL